MVLEDDDGSMVLRFFFLCLIIVKVCILIYICRRKSEVDSGNVQSQSEPFSFSDMEKNEIECKFVGEVQND